MGPRPLPAQAGEKVLILADTSAVLQFMHDRSGMKYAALQARLPEREEVAVTRFTVLETMQGARNERDWRGLEDFLAGLRLVEIRAPDWKAAARIYMDLRRRGLTVQSPIDCCIAQVALARGLPLLHRDRDFESIRKVRKSLTLMWQD